MSPLSSLEALGRYTWFAARAFLAAVGAIRRPRELLRQFDSVFIGAWPVASVSGVALGIVIWLHFHGVLVRTGSGYAQLLPQFLALAVVLEFAPLGAGLIVAGRSGASLGAELSAMQLAEQVDALEVLGLSPWGFLIGPRVLACMLALPLLTVVIAALAIGGGYLAESVGGTMSWLEFWHACLERLRLHEVILATLKTVVFGFLIGVAGCYVGLNAEGGAEGVGKAATRGVVLAILQVVLSDVILVRAIQFWS